MGWGGICFHCKCKDFIYVRRYIYKFMAHVCFCPFFEYICISSLFFFLDLLLMIPLIQIWTEHSLAFRSSTPLYNMTYVTRENHKASYNNPRPCKSRNFPQHRKLMNASFPAWRYFRFKRVSTFYRWQWTLHLFCNMGCTYLVPVIRSSYQWNLI
jgi:hypothetical protein